MEKFLDRREAGQRLAEKLIALKGQSAVIVLGIPRGGIVVADEIAQALDAPLDVFITRKIGAPFNHELALGAVASDGTVFLDQALIHQLHIPRILVEHERKKQLREIARRVSLYRGSRAPLIVENKIVILVDDGIATGSTTIAALRALRKQNPQRIILAVPVAPRPSLPILRAECDELVILDSPEPFVAVGLFYEDFGQVTDDKVVEILRERD
ncbi:MAG TPA: phosphoribosyltransferase [Anaerolineae bacterium]|nr:phosphoribosyltransferase [Anaerolineae bacterium]